MSESAAIDIEEPVDGVARVTIARPDRLNALREVEHDRMATIWPELDARPDVRAVVVTGRGKHFSAGGDLSFVSDVTKDDHVRANAWWSARRIVQNMMECRTPIVSALEGVAVGAGTAVALMSDICVAAEDARIIDGHLAFGASPGDHAAFLWPLAIGINRARGKLLLNEPVSGAEAAELGLVYEAVPSGQAVQRATELAGRLAALDPFAVAATKMSVNGVLRQHWSVFEASLALEFMCFTNTPVRAALERELDQRGAAQSERRAQEQASTEPGEQP